MSAAPGQLVMFEPTGSDLAKLAKTHASTAESLQYQVDNLKLRGFSASASAYARLCELSDDQATVCELALQFEQLAGLS